MSFSYANAGSGPSAGGIGWFDWGANFSINPGQTIPNLTGILSDGYTVTFDLTSQNVSGSPATYNSYPVPIYPVTFFGGTQYTGIAGSPALYSQNLFAAHSLTLTISNIVVKDGSGNPILNYTAILADAESTNTGESWSWTTNGTPWTKFDTIGSPAPLLTGLGSPIAVITGNYSAGNGPAADYLLATNSPTQMSLTVDVANQSARQAFALGFSITQVAVKKNIGARIDPADQFALNITGTPSNQAITTGTAVGLQPLFASVNGFAGNTYTINEAMAPGSVSALGAYTQLVSAVNLTPNGTTPPLTGLPVNFTPALGDNVVYTITNAAPERFTKTVDKAYAQPGDILTYTLTGTNPNNFPVYNVLINDPAPSGTSYNDNLTVTGATSYTGNPQTGLTVGLPANGTVSASWQVLVAAGTPVSNPIVNIASATVPGQTPINTNPVTTLVRYADLTSAGNFIKSLSPAYVQPNSLVSYTLTLHNVGNTAANGVALTDVIMPGTSYVPGSISASVPFTGDPTGTINLLVPIQAGDTVTITFQVLVSSTIPTTNPISNTANVSYNYLVDPTAPPVNTAGPSSTTFLQVSIADIHVVKTASENIGYLGDIITYTITVSNNGNVPADTVVITDPIPNGTILVPNSLTASVPYTGSLATALTLTNPIPAGGTATISYQVQVTAMPMPNPIKNIAEVTYMYTLIPGHPDSISASVNSNTAKTKVFKNNFSQQISDLIESVALEQTALSHILNAEGEKIQKIMGTAGVTTQQIIDVNNSVADMTNSISRLESILQSKLAIFDCQISGCDQ